MKFGYPNSQRSQNTPNPVTDAPPDTFSSSLLKSALIVAIALVVGVLWSGMGSAVGTYPAISSDLVVYYNFSHHLEPTIANLIDGRFNLTATNTPLFNATGGPLSDGDYLLNRTNYLNTTGYNPFATSTGFTLSLWVKNLDFTQDQSRFFALANTTSNNPLFGLGTPAGGGDEVAVYLRNSSNVVVKNANSVITLSDGYNHIVWSDNNGQVSLFINGQKDSGSWSYNSSGFTFNTIGIGAIVRSTAASQFNGSVDEVRMFNRSLSDTEIWDMYQTYIGCVTPTLNYQANIANAVYTFCPGTYNTQAANDGFIEAAATNVTLVGYGVTIIGNKTLHWPALFSRVSNVTFVGFTVSNTTRGLQFQDGEYQIGDDLTMSNDVTNAIILFRSNYSGVKNSRLEGTGSALATSNEYTHHNFFTGNSIGTDDDTDDLAYGRFLIYNASYYNISFNNFTSIRGASAINLNNFKHSWIEHNAFTDIRKYAAIVMQLNSSNNSIRYNSFYNLSQALWLRADVMDTYFEYNNVSEATNGYDGWNLAVYAERNVSGLYYRHNVVNKVGNGCVVWKETRGLEIVNNTCDILSMQEKLSRNSGANFIRDGNEPLCAYAGLLLYKTYPNKPGQNSSWTLETEIYKMRSFDVTIVNNTYGPNVQCFTRYQGTFNWTHDLSESSYYYYAWQFPLLLDREELFINKAFNNLSVTNNTYRYSETLFVGLYNSGRSWLDYKWGVDYEVYENRNWSLSYQVRLFNKSQALVINGTSSQACGASLVSDQCNVTVGPLNTSYVLDRYNKTEGTTRPYDPIAFVNTGRSVKTLNSSLVDPIYNVTVVVFTNGTTLESPRYVPHSGVGNVTLTSADYTLDSTAGTLEFIAPVIEPSAASNTLYLDSLGPRITIVSPAYASGITGTQMLFQTSVTDANIDSQWYELVGESGAKVFDGNEYVSLSAGTHNVRFCANDTSNNIECTQEVPFTLFAGYTVGGGGGGGSSGTGSGSNDSSTGAGGSAGLGWVNASVRSTDWIYGVAYPVTIRIYDADGKPYDTPFVTAEIVGNTSHKAGQLVRIGTGVYEQFFTISQTGNDKAIINVAVTENGITANQLLVLDLRDATGAEKFVAGTKARAESLVSRLYYLINEHYLVIGGIIVAALIVIMVIAYLRS